MPFPILYAGHCGRGAFVDVKRKSAMSPQRQSLKYQEMMGNGCTYIRSLHTAIITHVYIQLFGCSVFLHIRATRAREFALAIFDVRAGEDSGIRTWCQRAHPDIFNELPTVAHLARELQATRDIRQGN